MVLLVVEWLPSPLPHTRRPGDPRWASLVTHGPIGGVEWLPSHPYHQGGPEEGPGCSYWWWSGSLPVPHTRRPGILGGPVSLFMVLLVVEWLPLPLLHTRRPGDPRWASLVTHGPIDGEVASPHTHTRGPLLVTHPHTQGDPEILGGPASLLMVLLVVEWLPSPLPHTRRPGDPRWASLLTHGPIGGGVASLPPPHTRRPGDPRWASLVTHGPIGGGVASLPSTPHKEARRS